MPNQKKLKGVRTKKVQPLPQTEYRPNNYVPVRIISHTCIFISFAESI